MIRSLWMGLLGVLLAVSMYAFSPQAMAAATEADKATAEGYMNSIINQPYDETDLAHKSLVRLFGGFIFKPFGGAPADEPTVLAKVLGYTNVIAMILGVIIMAYVIVAGALNTAASGEMLGRSWSSVWLPLRTSLAFGMIVPATNGGEVFSVAQSLVIWMIIVGSNSATWLWEQGASALAQGTPVMPKVAFHNSGAASPLISTVFCSTIRSHLMEKKDGTAPEIGYIMNYDAGTSKYSYPRITLATLGTADLSKANRIVLDGCGVIALPDSSTALNNTALENSTNDSNAFHKSVAWEKAVQTAFDAAVRSGMNPFIVSAKTFSERVYTTGINGKKIQSADTVGGTEATNIYQAVNAAGQDYGTTTMAYETYLNQVQAQTIAAASSQGWEASMTAGGWMRAGAWFFEASRLQGFVQTLMGSLNTSSVVNEAPPGGCSFASSYTNCKDQREEYASWKSALSVISKSGESSPGAVSAQNSPGSMKLVSSVSSDGEDAQKLEGKALDTVSTNIASWFMNSIMYLGEDDTRGSGASVSSGGNRAQDTSGMISPFTAVSSLGRGLQQIGVTVWTAGLIVSGWLEVKDSAIGGIADFFSGSSLSFAAGVSKYIMSSLTPVLMGVGGLAFMLAFAIPFMPVTIWIMLVCGYLVTVIEAVAAAPLAVIMLATPEGEGISGSSFKQALQMINAIVLRPSLSIVGLFAAMTLSYVGFAILNDLFWSVGGLTSHASIFEVLAMIFIYASLAFKLCEYMVSVIYKIPDQIMQWMGGGMSREFGEQAAGQDMTQAIKNSTAASGVTGMAGMKTAGGIAKNKMDVQNARSKSEQEAQRHQDLMAASRNS